MVNSFMVKMNFPTSSIDEFQQHQEIFLLIYLNTNHTDVINVDGIINFRKMKILHPMRKYVYIQAPEVLITEWS